LRAIAWHHLRRATGQALARRLSGATGGLLLALLFASIAHAGTVSLMSCSDYRDPGLAWQPDITANLGADNACAIGQRFQLLQKGYALKGESANWQTISPAAITITAVATPAQSVLVDPNEGVPGYYTADFYL